MTLGAGTRIGAYEITGVLGVGGMGEVYRARDSALGREVALKVLPEAVAADRERVARFSREARLLASLDHPNIGAIYGWESSTAVQAIVLELIEGPTLRDRIATRSLPLDEALRIAHQVADALEEAHDQGIVHRDLKPANIKVRPDGRVKVLDFGLAKALEDDPTTNESAMTTGGATQTGIVVGTPAYMSPEQARGEKVTRKTDVWSFGIVLFEMLAGRHPFGNGASTEVVAAILRATPEWEALPAGTPSGITRLLRRCLEKDPRSRIHDIGDARLEIEDAISGRSSSPSGASHVAGDTATRGWSRGAHLAAAVAAFAIVGAAVTTAYFLGARRSTSQPTEVRLSIVAPFGTRFASTPAVSPDGRAVAFVAATPGFGGQLYVRPLASAGAPPLPGTDGATFPFWSPDGRALAFFAGQKLWRVNIGGADRPTKICDVAAGRGGTWLDDHTIIFADAFAPLSRVPDLGGQPVPLTSVNANNGELDHRFPSWIPGGYLLYVVLTSASQTSGVRLVALSAPNRALKFYPGIGAAEYDDGFLIFSETDQVRARRIHLPDGELGPVVPIGAARTAENAGRSALSSSAGVVAFIDPGEPTLGQFVWRGRDGSTTGTLGEPGANSGVELSPNRQELVTSGNALSVMDITKPAVLNPVFTGTARYPLWSSDDEVLFMGVDGVAPNTAKAALFSVSRSGNRPATLRTLPASVWPKPVAWTHDGALVWLQQGTGLDNDIWIKRSDQKKPALFLKTNARYAEGRLSPDGSWLAYASDQSGRFEIVVQSFPSPDSRIPVSADGGRFPRWRPDGRELYYLTRDFSALMAVSVTLGSPPIFGAPHKLFDVRLVTTSDPEQVVFGTYQYDVADSAGTRFLINQLVREPVQALDVILNWNQK